MVATCWSILKAWFGWSTSLLWSKTSMCWWKLGLGSAKTEKTSSDYHLCTRVGSRSLPKNHWAAKALQTGFLLINFWLCNPIWNPAECPEPLETRLSFLVLQCVHHCLISLFSVSETGKLCQEKSHRLDNVNFRCLAHRIPLDPTGSHGSGQLRTSRSFSQHVLSCTYRRRSGKRAWGRFGKQLTCFLKSGHKARWRKTSSQLLFCSSDIPSRTTKWPIWDFKTRTKRSLQRLRGLSITTSDML